MNDDHEDDQDGRGFKRLDGILGNMQMGLFGIETAAPAQEATPAKAKKGDKREARLKKAKEQIQEKPDDTENAFLAPELVQCLLPHTNPKDATVWGYRNGNYAIVIQSGVNPKTFKHYGLPWGSISKILLIWVATEAVLHQKRRIRLRSKSFNDFMRLLGLNPSTGGGKRGDAVRLKDHMDRFFNAIFTFDAVSGDEVEGEGLRKNMLVTEEQHQWWNFRSPEQGSLFESEILLSEKFFQVLIDNPVPFDIRAVAGLMRSPLAVDIYIWQKYRRFTMGKRGQKNLVIPLERLKEQFGREYKRLSDFKKELKKVVEKVKSVDEEFDYTLDSKNLTVHNKAAISAEQKAAAQKRLKEESPLDRVSDQARSKFKSEFPRFDADAAIADFYSWRADKGESSMNTDRHFLAFARTWVEKNR